MKIHKTGGQQTPEWINLKKHFFSATDASTIRVSGKGLDTLIEEKIIAEFSLGEKKHWETEDTKRGNRLEPIARNIFEMEFGKEVEEVDFVSNDRISKVVGNSPDGLVEKIEMFECKAPSDKVYYSYLLDNEKAKKQYYDQCQWQLWSCERKKNNLFIFNPNFEKSFVNIEIELDEEWVKDMEVKVKIAEKKWEAKREEFIKLMK